MKQYCGAASFECGSGSGSGIENIIRLRFQLRLLSYGFYRKNSKTFLCGSGSSMENNAASSGLGSATLKLKSLKV
jgi:hypothetical protein